MSNFLNNFIGGFAFGMLANNPFYGCCYGYGGGYSYPDIVDFGTFANPFPAVSDGNYVEKPSIFTTFANPFPTIDFSGITETIWNEVTNPDSDTNKRMREYYKNLEEQKNSSSSSTQISIPQIQYPFSSFYMPTEITMNPYISGFNPFGGFYGMNNQKAQEKEEKKTNSEQTTQQKEEKTNISYDAKELKTKWKSKTGNVPDEFYTKVIDISKKIKCNPNDLMAVMNLESRGFKLTAVNPISGATGLIQFMPDTAKALGTTTEKLAKMSAMEQLEYVDKYLSKTKSDAGFSSSHQLTDGELYSLIFRPKYSKNEVLARRGEKAYTDNKLLDKNKDGYITKDDLSKSLKEFMA